jgi:hypothetical protein
LRLENLYRNFATDPPEEQAAYISFYRLRRAEDLATASEKKTSPAKSSKIDLSLTDEEKVIMKLLGLKQKDIVALRMNNATEEVDGTDLFKDSTFEEDEE